MATRQVKSKLTLKSFSDNTILTHVAPEGCMFIDRRKGNVRLRVGDNVGTPGGLPININSNVQLKRPNVLVMGGTYFTTLQPVIVSDVFVGYDNNAVDLIHDSSDWQIANDYAFEDILFETLNNTAQLDKLNFAEMGWSLPPRVNISDTKSYYARKRNTISLGVVSEWSIPVEFKVSFSRPKVVNTILTSDKYPDENVFAPSYSLTDDGKYLAAMTFTYDGVNYTKTLKIYDRTSNGWNLLTAVTDTYIKNYTVPREHMSGMFYVNDDLIYILRTDQTTSTDSTLATTISYYTISTNALVFKYSGVYASGISDARRYSELYFSNGGEMYFTNNPANNTIQMVTGPNAFNGYTFNGQINIDDSSFGTSFGITDTGEFLLASDITLAGSSNLYPFKLGAEGHTALPPIPTSSISGLNAPITRIRLMDLGTEVGMIFTAMDNNAGIGSLFLYKFNKTTGAVTPWINTTRLDFPGNITQAGEYLSINRDASLIAITVKADTLNPTAGQYVKLYTIDGNNDLLFLDNFILPIGKTNSGVNNRQSPMYLTRDSDTLVMQYTEVAGPGGLVIY